MGMWSRISWPDGSGRASMRHNHRLRESGCAGCRSPMVWCQVTGKSFPFCDKPGTWHVLLWIRCPDGSPLLFRRFTMTHRFVLRFVVLVCAWVAVSLSFFPLSAEAKKGKKYALLVGVTEYDTKHL